MKKKKIILVVVLMTFCTLGIFGQDDFKSCSVGSSLFMLGNFAPGDPPYYGQLNFSYYFTPKDVLILEGITWTYYEPLGTYGKSEENYPGKVRSTGLGIGYQRFWWKGVYTSFLAIPFLQNYFDPNDSKIQSGFQLYLQARLGYRFEFFKDRWFLEPSAAFNYWPVNTNLPDSFAQIEEGAPQYIIEPGLHFGFRF